MATKLFLRSSQNNGLGAAYYDMLVTAGSSSTTAVVNTAGSGTEIQWTLTGGGQVIQFVSGRAPAGGFTLTNTDISIWAHESAAQANSGGRYRVFKRTAAGVETEIGGGPFNDGVEFGTSAAEMLWAGNVTDTAFAEDDRILLKIYITNVGTMGSGRTCTLTYNGANAATGDSFFNIAETVTFKAEAVSIAPGIANESESAVGLGIALSLAPAAETETALALGAALKPGIASESDQALALAGKLVGAVGLASEAEIALALSLGLSVGLAFEVDTALALAPGLSLPCGVAGEADSALALGLARPPGIASETEAALALALAISASPALEADAAFGLGIGRAIAPAIEADSALGLGLGLAPGGADEINSALSLGIAIGPGFALESEAALALPAMLIGTPGIALELDQALALEQGSGSIEIPCGLANDNEMAFGLGLALGPGLSLEIDLALALPPASLIPFETPPKRTIAWPPRNRVMRF